ncbi:hypothetical protein Loa_00952 [Legionella oakridgensis ATCC 33761 = DSM 21215]|uniref:Uncharacterized protein n=3 Tax=Legionella oakridgensis TaxID=29423 RepID=W0BCT6_9GAMM|nr:hypothetical protein Loa_00952 [Legionella oakridgensis ATCC 33761 = DSM 21215]ETO93777.1 hypothetical protein LOR_73c21230 [Legionella oakridgensis RV-2-2007]KTD43922.1 hypothetical protein Loak_0472 [Legionella oakridgensis]STY19673.1 Uncharacterised protein [Legionella longbeachae]
MLVVYISHHESAMRMALALRELQRNNDPYVSFYRDEHDVYHLKAASVAVDFNQIFFDEKSLLAFINNYQKDIGAMKCALVADANLGDPGGSDVTEALISLARHFQAVGLFTAEASCQEKASVWLQEQGFGTFDVDFNTKKAIHAVKEQALILSKNVLSEDVSLEPKPIGLTAATAPLSVTRSVSSSVSAAAEDDFTIVVRAKHNPLESFAVPPTQPHETNRPVIEQQSEVRPPTCKKRFMDCVTAFFHPRRQVSPESVVKKGEAGDEIPTIDETPGPTGYTPHK